MIETLGWIALIAAILLWFAFIDQIRLNLEGQKGSLIIPIVVVVNCLLWTAFGIGKRNWQLVAANALGIVIGAVTAFTAI
ncbi:MAG: hypothetical protein HY445_02125 [Candidatus Niyogibacteria bacterium]|nr:hypothetical protein [Candidatus Niyogibacteria bacterium]